MWGEVFGMRGEVKGWDLEVRRKGEEGRKASKTIDRVSLERR